KGGAEFFGAVYDTARSLLGKCYNAYTTMWGIYEDVGESEIFLDSPEGVSSLVAGAFDWQRRLNSNDVSADVEVAGNLTNSRLTGSGRVGERSWVVGANIKNPTVGNHSLVYDGVSTPIGGFKMGDNQSLFRVGILDVEGRPKTAVVWRNLSDSPKNKTIWGVSVAEMCRVAGTYDSLEGHALMARLENGVNDVTLWDAPLWPILEEGDSVQEALGWMASGEEPSELYKKAKKESINWIRTHFDWDRKRIAMTGKEGFLAIERAKRASHASEDYDKVRSAILHSGSIAGRFRTMMGSGELFEIFPELKELKRVSQPSIFWEGIDALEHVARVLGVLQQLSVASQRLMTNDEEGFRAAFLVFVKISVGKLADLDIETFRQLCNIYREATATDEDKELLWLSVLLHDIGKAVHVLDHANVGLRPLALILDQYGFTGDRRMKAELLMKHHALFGELMLAERTPFTIKELFESFRSPKDRTKLLDMVVLMNIADMKGVGETGRLFTAGIRDILRYRDLVSDEQRFAEWVRNYPDERLLQLSQNNEETFRHVKEMLRNSLRDDEMVPFEEFLRKAEANYFGHLCYGLSEKSLANTLYLWYQVYTFMGNDPFVMFSPASKNVIKKFDEIMSGCDIDGLRERFTDHGRAIETIMGEFGIPVRFEESAIILDIGKLMPPAQVPLVQAKIQKVPWGSRSKVTKSLHLFIPGKKITDIFDMLHINMYQHACWPNCTRDALNRLTPFEVSGLLEIMSGMEKDRPDEFRESGFQGIYIDPALSTDFIDILKNLLRAGEDGRIRLSIVDKQTLNIELVSQHAFMPVSFGGLDWVAISAATIAAGTYYLMTHYQQISYLGIFGSVMLGIMALIFFATSFMRFTVSMAVVYKIHGYSIWDPINLWKALTTNVGRAEYLPAIKEISPYIYGQIAYHETFPTHFRGLLAFVPGLGLIVTAFEALGREFASVFKSLYESGTINP
ncbi:MAG: hypothetical protein PHN63_06915, partial [Candidatus Omnitrophica bacterium]|nr:hypothetical protein [Candidatus Omnitrophota bacterium]